MVDWIFHPFSSLCSQLEKCFFKGIDIIQIFLLPDRLQKLQPTEIFLSCLPEKSVQYSDNGATHYLLETTAPTQAPSLFACRDYFHNRSLQIRITSSYLQTTVCAPPALPSSQLCIHLCSPVLMSGWMPQSGENKKEKGRKKKKPDRD